MTTDGSERYVVTKAIREAVRERETDILDALGIDWRSGRPHIRCPYPAHADDHPSWRWDARKDRAFCSCIDGARKADGVFDVVAKVRAVDFDGAKLIVAELLGRSDLIRTAGAGGQKTDAAALLNPAAADRDDRLVASYIAARLGLDEPTAAPLPSTRTAGWRALDYYDAPAGKGGKPKRVASPPCAVFGTVAADGRQHAHRVYVSADGRGKAELGVADNGKQRDPKKSARRRDGAASTAGCCVVWGDPDTEHVILAEGIETAAAIAYAHLEQIVRHELAVLSAISAGGIEAFTPWPATRRITVAADRDEDKTGRGFKRGERAARHLGLRLHLEQYSSAIQLLIALPDAPGTNTDFLDLLRNDAVEAVRAAISAAEPFEATPEQIEEFKQRGARKSEIETIGRHYPLPQFIGLRVEYRRTETAAIWLHKYAGTKEDPDSGEQREIWEAVASPFGNFVLLQTPGERIAHGLRVHVQTFSGGSNIVDFIRSDLPKLAASAVRAELMNAGLRVANGGEATLLEILKQVQPTEFIRTAIVFGWNEAEFLTPAGRTANDYWQAARGVER